MEFSRALGAPIDSLPCPECRIVPDDAQDIVNSMHVDGGAHAGTVLEDTIVVTDNDDTQEIPDGQPHEDDVRILRMSEIPCPFGLDSPEFYENQVHPSAEALAVIAEGALLDAGDALLDAGALLDPERGSTSRCRRREQCSLP